MFYFAQLENVCTYHKECKGNPYSIISATIFLFEANIYCSYAIWMSIHHPYLILINVDYLLVQNCTVKSHHDKYERHANVLNVLKKSKLLTDCFMNVFPKFHNKCSSW